MCIPLWLTIVVLADALVRWTLQGNVSAQVAYSQDNARWHFPSLYHSRSFTSEDGTTVDVILIDTVDLSGKRLYRDIHRMATVLA